MTKKDYIVCVDSDGCAMDTMNIKHIRFFGPLAADIFAIKNREAFLTEWNRINLFSETRGINRFTALVLLLDWAKTNGETIVDLNALKSWANTTTSLSNDSLEDEIKKKDDTGLQKALKWSHAVNNGIHDELTGEDKPFPGAKEGLEAISKVANVAIVSSANLGAVESEWTRHDLMPFVDYVYGQERGTKAAAIADIHSTLGYPRDHILMVGDAPGDEKAAVTNHVYYFPILFGEEKKSWHDLVTYALPTFIEGKYGEKLNEEMAQKFHNHLMESTQ